MNNVHIAPGHFEVKRPPSWTEIVSPSESIQFPDWFKNGTLECAPPDLQKMMYNILLLRELDPGALQIELAAIFRISPRDVDVSDQDEMEERNWNAIVSCDFAQGSGDIPWKLSIYA